VENGVAVAVSGRNKSVVDELAQAIRSEGGQAIGVVADVTQYADLNALREIAMRHTAHEIVRDFDWGTTTRVNGRVVRSWELDAIDKEIDLLVRRLARSGLLEYRLAHSSDDNELVVIEPQMPDYWPQTPKLGNADTIVLSRFAYLRRRGNDMVLESPRAGALFRICDPKIAAALAVLSTPQKISRFRRQDGFPGIEVIALLVDCQILFKLDATGGDGLRAREGDDNLVLWDFHDLLFHTHSTEGRQANPLGGLYPYAGAIAPLPAVRPRWPGKKIDLRELAAASPLSGWVSSLLTTIKTPLEPARTKNTSPGFFNCIYNYKP